MSAPSSPRHSSRTSRKHRSERTSDATPTSPRVLRRARTQEEFNTKYKEELEKIKARSDLISRHHDPGKATQKLLDEVSKFPRPCSASNSEAFIQALQSIRVNNRGYEHEDRIQELEKRPDLKEAVRVARRSNSIEPLKGWPQSVWTEDVFRSLLFRRQVVQEDGLALTIKLARHWVGKTQRETAFRDHQSKALLTFAINELDSWKPDPDRDESLFEQCCLHYSELNSDLNNLLKRLRTRLNLLPEILLRAINVNVLMPRALASGFTAVEIKLAMHEFIQDSDELNQVYSHLFPDYEIPELTFV